MNKSHYITRNKVIAKACHDIICEMYRRAQPAGDFEYYEDCYSRGILDKNKDKCTEWHYLPMEVQSQIIEDYLKAYCADDQMKYWFNQLMELFKEGGLRTTYRDIFGNGEKVRSGEPTEKLPELIGNDNAEKVYRLMKDFMGFYRTNLDECAIRETIFFCPAIKPETVIEKWGDKVKIDDSVYKNPSGEWDYTWKDYYDGKVTCDGD